MRSFPNENVLFRCCCWYRSGAAGLGLKGPNGVNAAAHAHVPDRAPHIWSNSGPFGFRSRFHPASGASRLHQSRLAASLPRCLASLNSSTVLVRALAPTRKDRTEEELTFSQRMRLLRVPFLPFNPHLCSLHWNALFFFFPPWSEREERRGRKEGREGVSV